MGPGWPFGYIPDDRASLGSIGKQETGRVTVHVPYPMEEYTESLTSRVLARLLRGRRIEPGDTVALDLEKIRIAGRGYAWFCDSLEVVE